MFSSLLIGLAKNAIPGLVGMFIGDKGEQFSQKVMNEVFPPNFLELTPEQQEAVLKEKAQEIQQKNVEFEQQYKVMQLNDLNMRDARNKFKDHICLLFFGMIFLSLIWAFFTYAVFLYRSITALAFITSTAILKFDFFNRLTGTGLITPPSTRDFPRY